MPLYFPLKLIKSLGKDESEMKMLMYNHFTVYDWVSMYLSASQTRHNVCCLTVCKISSPPKDFSSTCCQKDLSEDVNIWQRLVSCKAKNNTIVAIPLQKLNSRQLASLFCSALRATFKGDMNDFSEVLMIEELVSKLKGCCPGFNNFGHVTLKVINDVPQSAPRVDSVPKQVFLGTRSEILGTRVTIAQLTFSKPFCSHSGKYVAAILQGLLKALQLKCCTFSRTASVQGAASFQGTATSQGTTEIQRTADFQDIWRMMRTLDIYALKPGKLGDSEQTSFSAKRNIKLKASSKLSKFVQPSVQTHALWVEIKTLKSKRDEEKAIRKRSSVNWEE
ncbi:hypothetical protein Tco_0324764 [Tanacetum coccineum]